jgi:hypothetical protein
MTFNGRRTINIDHEKQLHQNERNNLLYDMSVGAR